MQPSVTAKVWGLALPIAVATLSGCVADNVDRQPLATDRADVVPIDAQAEDDGGIVKWVRAVRIALVGGVTERQRRLVEDRASWLSKTTGHSVEVSAGEKGNLVLVFEDASTDPTVSNQISTFAPLYSSRETMEADFRDDGEKDLCIAKRVTRQTNPYELAYAAGLVPGGLDDKETKACIARLLVSAMIPSASKGRPLVEAENNGGETSQKKLIRGLTNISEVILLKVIYDDRVEPGMTSEDVQPITSEVAQRVFKSIKK